MISTRALIFCSEIVWFFYLLLLHYIHLLFAFAKIVSAMRINQWLMGHAEERQKKKMAFGFHSLFSYSRGSDFCHGPILPMAIQHLISGGGDRACITDAIAVASKC